MDPSVTVIIPTYNWSSVLPYSIGSVVRQTFADFELLVVGDGCTDDSEAVVGRIGDSRVRWINLPTNTGHQSEPNNEGLRQARGQYIAYLGHDDLWLPHHLSCLVSTLKQGADLAYGAILFLVAGPYRYHGYHRSFYPFFESYQGGVPIPPTSVVHRRSVTDHVGGWRHYRELHTPPDTELWQRAYTANYRFAFVPRLTAIKFQASARRHVYKIRPCHEQAAWSERIQNEDGFEAAELIRTVLPMVPEYHPKPYRTVLHEFMQRTRNGLMGRIRRLISPPDRPKGDSIDDSREFKGLPRLP
jgi:glycosyltransferase involved in cell wall biosynthesis